VYIQRIYAKNFRNFDECCFEFSVDTHVIVGDNGVGKTSLLEALFLCITGISFRTQYVKELIRFQQKGFFVEVMFLKDDIPHTLSISYDGAKRRVSLNNAPCKSATELFGVLAGVSITPDDIALVEGSPSIRRRFLDLALVQVDPLYVRHLRRYHQALKQRNALLKQKKPATLFCFSEELARSGAYLILERQKFLDYIRPKTKDFFNELLGCDAIGFEMVYESVGKTYDDHASLYEHLKNELKIKLEQEMHYGLTLVGPHRDDIELRLKKKDARAYASIGQKRILSHAMRLAEWHFLKERLEVEPLMIVDDFATSLDDAKTMRFASLLATLGQVFLSSTEVAHTKIGDKKLVVVNLQESKFCTCSPGVFEQKMVD